MFLTASSELPDIDDYVRQNTQLSHPSPNPSLDKIRFYFPNICILL